MLSRSLQNHLCALTLTEQGQPLKRLQEGSSQGLSVWSVAEHMLSVLKALGSIPSTIKIKFKRRKEEKRERARGEKENKGSSYPTHQPGKGVALYVVI